MNYNFFDLFLILFILFGGIIGFKRGVIKQIVITFGIIIVLFISFNMKDSLSLLMYKTLPFFTTGILNNYSSLNIIIYELSAFLLLFSLLTTILVIFIKISKIVEKLLRVTVILAIPSKILGFILGIIENYLISLVFLVVLLNPTFNIKTLPDSKVSNFILKNTPIVSIYTDKYIDSFNEIKDLLEDKNKYDDKIFNCKLQKILINNKIVSKESIDYLIKSGKIYKKCK